MSIFGNTNWNFTTNLKMIYDVFKQIQNVFEGTLIEFFIASIFINEQYLYRCVTRF